MTRRDALERVLDGLRAAERAGLAPIKLNCVVVRGTNEDEVVDFARFARATGYQVRFIEFMPLDAEQGWSRDRVVPSEEVLAAIGRVYPLVPVDHGPEPARVFCFADGAPGGVGVIASVSEPFCGDCNRIRRSEEHTSELQSQSNLVCRLLLEKKKKDSQRPCGTYSEYYI